MAIEGGQRSKVTTSLDVTGELQLSESSGADDQVAFGLDQLEYLSHSYANVQRLHLGELIPSCQNRESSDPRDQIYALRGLMSPRDQAMLFVDYHKTTAEVYVQAMEVLLSDGMGLRLIEDYSGTLRNRSHHNLPSWVPDFGFFKKPIPPWWRCRCGGEVQSSEMQILDDRRTLQVKAVILDKVDTIIDFETTIEQCTQQLVVVHGKYREASELLSNSTEDKDPFRDLHTAQQLWRILLWDTDWNFERPAPEPWSSVYDLLVDREHSENKRSPWQLEKDVLHTESKRFYDCLGRMIFGNTFFLSRKDLAGIGNRGIAKGDLISVWLGADLPFIIRLIEGGDDAAYELVAVSYVGGVMDGCVVDRLLPEGRVELEMLRVQ